MATATIVVTEKDDGSVGVSATFDPKVKVDDLENIDQLPAAHYVALGMVSYAQAQLGGDGDGEQIVASADGD